MELKIGDVVRGTMQANQGIEREIVKVRKSGYDWRYPGVPDKVFASENSTDPKFELGWERLHRP